MGRRKAQRCAAVDDIFAEAYCHLGHAVFGFFLAYRIVVERAAHAGERREVEIAVLLAYNFLNDDGHLLLVDDIARGVHIGFRCGIEHRGVDGLDGVGEHVKHLVRVVVTRNHIGGIDSGKWLIVGVFEQR